MKKITSLTLVFIGLLFCSTSLVNAQGIGVNSSGNPADPSAALDVSGTSKGVLINRMTGAERNAIVNPALGLLIFNTTTNCINMWLGSTWKKLCGDCDFTNPVPGNNGPQCEGGTLLLTSTSVGNGATFQWSGPNGFVSTQQNPSISSATIAASGSYSVVATLNGCASAPQSTVATVNATPQTPVAGNNGPLCTGNTLSLSSTTVIGAGYLWSGPNSFTANTQNPTIANVQTVNDGTYNVIASVSGCNSAAGTTTVVVNAIPAAPGSISGATSACPNSTGNIYSISTVPGATSYNWTVPPGASISANTGTSITVTFGNSFGDITVTASNSCGTSTASSVTVTATSAVLCISSGPTIWLKADAGVTLSGNAVTQWNDQSGNSNHFSQNTSAYQPTLLSNHLNGLPVVRFDGTNDSLSSSNSQTIGTAFIVAGWEGGGTDFPDYNGMFTSRDGTGPASGIIFIANSGSTILYSNIFTPNTFVNGVQTDDLSPILSYKVISGFCSPVVFNNLLLGHDRIYGGRDWNGGIAEVIVYNVALSTTDRQAIENYLKVKWGL